MENKPPKSILKKEEKPKKKKKGIVWDEQNLKETEAAKDSKMKITEPKTPYNHDYSASEDSSASATPTKSPVSPRKGENNGNTGVIENQWDELQKKIEEQKEKQDSGESLVNFKTEEDKKKEFERKRKQHYNEFIVAKKLLAVDEEKIEDE
eukprot:TRINITY_DN1554_c0_g1_i6.p1 TRINITY_DN1554_c0_g1~~TRINITY_DN1554_c0_g1_i6.p1  ORF type:complete len:173 (+),score=57.25 TRINITY_DN1554_c0_g1_i6:69-521(+)